MMVEHLSDHQSSSSIPKRHSFLPFPKLRFFNFSINLRLNEYSPFWDGNSKEQGIEQPVNSRHHT